MSEISIKFKDKILDTIPLNKPTITIGRSPNNDIKIDNPAVSQIHAQVTFINDQYIVEDTKSLNGTFVNGKKISKYVLKNGDQIKIGKHVLEISIQNDDFNAVEISPNDVFEQIPINAGGTVILDTKHQRELLQKNLSGSSGIFSKRVRIRVLEGIKTNKDYFITSDTIRIGSGKKCLVKLQGFLITGNQAVITKAYSGYIIKHTGGWRHTRVNGRIITEVPLGNNDIIQVGKNKLQFILEQSDN
ncbi:FHA domain-containing protein [bacterium]|nr:FHA domain-containing protein [bacterium]